MIETKTSIEESSMSSKLDKPALWMVLGIYTALITVISMFHEPWRDEVHRLLISIESQSVLDLFKNLHNTGHPFLWNMVLYAGWCLTKNLYFMQAANLAICVLAAYLCLFRSPFSAVQKILFLLGYYPLYQYAAFSTNYALGMLLLFLFCSVYEDRFKKIIYTSTILFLLANTHACYLAISSAAGMALLMESILFKIWSSTKLVSKLRLALGFSIITFGIIFSAFQIYPDDSTIVTMTTTPDFRELLHHLLGSIKSPMQPFSAHLGINSFVFASLLLWLILFTLIRKPFVFAYLFLGSITINLIFRVWFKPMIWHSGTIYLLIISAFWLDSCKNSTVISLPFSLKKLLSPLDDFKKPILYFFLIMQVSLAYPAVKSDITRDYSSAKAFATYLNTHPDLKDAILIGEPDYLMITMPLYVSNNIYSPREKAYRTFFNFSGIERRLLSLGDLLRVAQEIKEKTGKPVLIAMGHELSRVGPFEIWMSYSQKFDYSEKDLDRFLQSTRKIASFRNSISDERYDIYLLSDKNSASPTT